MRIRTRFGAAWGAVLLALAGAGCASSAGTPTLNLAVTVPVNHATVGVRAVDVVGTVNANRARAKVHLRVHGHRVRVRRGGTFTAHVMLHRGLNHIHLVAAAPGFPRTASTLLVRFGRPRRPAPTLADRVNAICGHDSARQFLMASGASTPNMSLLTRLLHVDRVTVSRLAALAAPPAQRAGYATFVTTVRTLVSGEKALVSDVQQHSLAGLQADARVLAAHAQRFNALAQAMSFIGCLSSS
jgi:hypothetical protein